MLTEAGPQKYGSVCDEMRCGVLKCGGSDGVRSENFARLNLVGVGGEEVERPLG